MGKKKLTSFFFVNSFKLKKIQDIFNFDTDALHKNIL